MNAKKIYQLNTPEFEINVELALIINGRFSALKDLVVEGWGIYPEILNLLIAFNYHGLIDELLKSAHHEKYPLEQMRNWLEAYYGEQWKLYVKRFNFNSIAAAYFSASEIKELEMNATPLCGSDEIWQKMLISMGMDAVKSTYMHMRNLLHQGSPEEDVKKVLEIERFLLTRGEYEYLYSKEAWQTLSSTLEGCKYIAEVKQYMNGLAMCLLNYYQTMDSKARDYCIKQLDYASLDDNYRPRYKEWRAKYVL